jgi:hypothetical protein
MPSICNKPIMPIVLYLNVTLSVVMLNVVMLNVVVTCWPPCTKQFRLQAFENASIIYYL